MPLLITDVKGAYRSVMDMTTTIDRDTPYPYPLESAGHIRVRTEGARTITDDNMGTEWNR